MRIEYLGPSPTTVAASFTNGRLDIVGSAPKETITVGTVNVGGVQFVVVNGQMVGDGVHTSH